MKLDLDRPFLRGEIERALKRNPIVALLGPRQCGKTTLAHRLSKDKRGTIFDLENPRDLAQLENPLSVLESERGLVVLDEIQNKPDLLPILRVLGDRRPMICRFLILGSASPTLIKGASESLAGRVEFVAMSGFSLPEVGTDQLRRRWLRGGFPRSFLARSDNDSMIWRENFIQTFLERDLPKMGIQTPAMTLRRFWTMVAHYHAQTWNGSEIAASLGVSHPMTRHYVDLLTQAYMLRQLPPWCENVGKRIVKAPKVYIRDSGLLHALLQLPTTPALRGHPKYGASWEGFALEEILSQAGDRDAYFWATHGGAELDLLLIRQGKRWGFEFKSSEAPIQTKSMHVAQRDLKLDHLWVVYPGAKTYSLDPKTTCISLADALALKIIRAKWARSPRKT